MNIKQIDAISKKFLEFLRDQLKNIIILNQDSEQDQDYDNEYLQPEKKEETYLNKKYIYTQHSGMFGGIRSMVPLEMYKNQDLNLSTEVLELFLKDPFFSPESKLMIEVGGVNKWFIVPEVMEDYIYEKILK